MGADYLAWLKARIEHAEKTGELWMLDELAIARAWSGETQAKEGN